MSSWSEEVEDLLVATSLGVATPSEVAWVERAAATDPELARRLAALREASTALAEDVASVKPPSKIRRRVLSEVRQDSRRAGRSAWFGWITPAVAGAAVAVAIAVGVVIGIDRTDHGVEEVAVEQVASAEIKGELVIFPGDQPSVLRLRGLEPLEPGLGYAVWRFDGKGVEPGGFLSIMADGGGVASIPAVAETTRLAVTIEPRDNTDAPTSAPLIEVDTA